MTRIFHRLGSPHSGFGFSLIELLIVLFIISLMAGIVAVQINIGGDQGAGVEIEDQVEELLRASALAEDQAVLTGLPYGLLIEAPTAEHDWQLRWLRYRQGQWSEAGEPFATHSMSQAIEVVTEVEGELLEFENFITVNPVQIPSIVFYPGGEVTPFNMTLYSTESVDASAVLSSEITGRVERVEDDVSLQALN